MKSRGFPKIVWSVVPDGIYDAGRDGCFWPWGNCIYVNPEYSRRYLLLLHEIVHWLLWRLKVPEWCHWLLDRVAFS